MKRLNRCEEELMKSEGARVKESAGRGGVDKT